MAEGVMHCSIIIVYSLLIGLKYSVGLYAIKIEFSDGYSSFKLLNRMSDGWECSGAIKRWERVPIFGFDLAILRIFLLTSLYN